MYDKGAHIRLRICCMLLCVAIRHKETDADSGIINPRWNTVISVSLSQHKSLSGDTWSGHVLARRAHVTSYEPMRRAKQQAGAASSGPIQYTPLLKLAHKCAFSKTECAGIFPVRSIKFYSGTKTAKAVAGIVLMLSSDWIWNKNQFHISPLSSGDLWSKRATIPLLICRETVP